MLGAAFLAGFIDSIVGGGGLIQVPALFAGFPDTPAPVLLGTNKLGSICGTGGAVYRYSRFIRIPWRMLLPGICVAFGAALLGASWVQHVPAGVFKPLIPIMLSLVLGYVLWDKHLGKIHAPRMSAHRSAGGVVLMAAIGLYDGFFGPGTGSFLMLLFIRVYGFDFLHASAAARVINVATNAGALVYFGLHAEIHWMLGLGLGLCNAGGSIVGTRAARLHGSRFVRKLFIGVVALLIAKTAWNAL